MNRKVDTLAEESPSSDPIIFHFQYYSIRKDKVNAIFEETTEKAERNAFVAVSRLLDVKKVCAKVNICAVLLKIKEFRHGSESGKEASGKSIFRQLTNGNLSLTLVS